MKVLSVKQPHAFLLAIGAKDIENRTWKLPEKYKGERVLIHASGKTDKEPYMLFTDKQAAAIDHRIMRIIDSYNTKSAIIGSVRFVDCVINYKSIWAKQWISKKWHNGTRGGIYDIQAFNWLAADPILFDKPILGVKGKLGFWEYSHPMCCPICGYPLHLQKTGDIITDMFCFNCKKDIVL